MEYDSRRERLASFQIFGRYLTSADATSGINDKAARMKPINCLKNSSLMSARLPDNGIFESFAFLSQTSPTVPRLRDFD